MNFVISLLNSEDLSKNISNDYQAEIIQNLLKSLEIYNNYSESFSSNIVCAINLIYSVANKLTSCSKLYEILILFAHKLENILRSSQSFIPTINFSEITSIESNYPIYIQNGSEMVDLEINIFKYCLFSPDLEFLRFNISKYLNDYISLNPDKLKLEEDKIYIFSFKFNISNKLGYKLVYQNIGDNQIKFIIPSNFENKNNKISRIKSTESYNLTESINESIITISFPYKYSKSYGEKLSSEIKKGIDAKKLDDGNYLLDKSIIHKEDVIQSKLQENNLYTIYYNSIETVDVDKFIDIYFLNGLEFIPKIYLLGDIYKI